MAAMEYYLEISDEVKVEIKALELLMDPEDSEVRLQFKWFGGAGKALSGCDAGK